MSEEANIFINYQENVGTIVNLKSNEEYVCCNTKWRANVALLFQSERTWIECNFFGILYATFRVLIVKQLARTDLPISINIWLIFLQKYFIFTRKFTWMGDYVLTYYEWLQLSKNCPRRWKADMGWPGTKNNIKS